MVTTPFNAATAAYGNASRLISQAAKPTTDLSAAVGGTGNDFAQMLAQQVQSVSDSHKTGDRSNSSDNFAQMLAQQVQGVMDAGKVSDRMSIDMVNGKANVVDMVTALSQTEMAIESMVTVRDRVISAYEEIMRMPI